MREHFVTCERMKELERLTDERGLSYYQMMENAGTCAFAEIMSRSGARRGQSSVVFCGKGNNGGKRRNMRFRGDNVKIGSEKGTEQCSILRQRQ